jgi:ketosteroid isomerase-like protein
MKKIMITALFILGNLGLSAQINDKILILKLLEDQRKAWNRGDLVDYMQGYLKSDSLLFVGKSGPQYGWDSTLANYKKSYPDKKAMGFLSFDIKEVRLISNDHAFVLGAWHLKREKDEPKGHFTLIVKKIGDEWKVIVDHSS